MRGKKEMNLTPFSFFFVLFKFIEGRFEWTIGCGAVRLVYFFVSRYTIVIVSNLTATVIFTLNILLIQTHPELEMFPTLNVSSSLCFGTTDS